MSKFNYQYGPYPNPNKGCCLTGNQNHSDQSDDSCCSTAIIDFGGTITAGSTPLNVLLIPWNRVSPVIPFATAQSSAIAKATATLTIPGTNCQKRIIKNVIASVTLNSDPSFISLDDSNNLYFFDLLNTNSFTFRPILGIMPGQTAVGLDFRPSNGQLYLLANGPSDAQLYTITINPTSIVATPVGSAIPPLSGTQFGVNFNPVADRLRVVSDAGLNIRINPDTGTITNTDANVVYAVGDPGFGTIPSVGGISYTNSFQGATTTTLYDIETARNVLVTQNPPNDGTLNTVGPLNVIVSQVLGFDIHPSTNAAFALLIVNGITGLYNINLVTGNANLISNLSGGNLNLRSVAIIPSITQSQLRFIILNNSVASDLEVVVPVTNGVTSRALGNSNNCNKTNSVCVIGGDQISVQVLNVNTGSLPSSGLLQLTFELE